MSKKRENESEETCPQAGRDKRYVHIALERRHVHRASKMDKEREREKH